MAIWALLAGLAEARPDATLDLHVNLLLFAYVCFFDLQNNQNTPKRVSQKCFPDSIGDPLEVFGWLFWSPQEGALAPGGLGATFVSTLF